MTNPQAPSKTLSNKAPLTHRLLMAGGLALAAMTGAGLSDTAHAYDNRYSVDPDTGYREQAFYHWLARASTPSEFYWAVNEYSNITRDYLSSVAVRYDRADACDTPRLFVNIDNVYHGEQAFSEVTNRPVTIRVDGNRTHRLDAVVNYHPNPPGLSYTFRGDPEGIVRQLKAGLEADIVLPESARTERRTLSFSLTGSSIALNSAKGWCQMERRGLPVTDLWPQH